MSLTISLTIVSVTDHVHAEITEHYPDQLQRLAGAFAAGTLEEIRVTDLQEVQLFAQLAATGLGIGECSAIAVAAHRNLALAIERYKLRKTPIDAPALGREDVSLSFATAPPSSRLSRAAAIILSAESASKVQRRPASGYPASG